MRIQVYGTGCSKCETLAANARAALTASGIPGAVEKVTDINAITDAGVLMTPALAIDGKIVGSGRVFSKDEISTLIANTPSTSNREPPARQPRSTGTVEQTKPDNTAAADSTNSTKNWWRRIFVTLLLGIVVLSTAAAIWREVKGTTDSTAAPQLENIASDATIVYYFHGNQRCATCRTIETLTTAAITENFATEIANKKVLFYAVNIDEKRNEHFLTDFNLDARSVIIQKGDHYENFPDIWELFNDPPKFKEYIRQGVIRLMGT